MAIRKVTYKKGELFLGKRHTSRAEIKRLSGQHKLMMLLYDSEYDELMWTQAYAWDDYRTVQNLKSGKILYCVDSKSRRKARVLKPLPVHDLFLQGAFRW